MESTISLQDTCLFLGCGQLPPTIQIRNRPYETVSFLQILEEIYQKPIICKRENRLRKEMINVTLRVPILDGKNQYSPLQLIGRKQIYTLTPRWRK
ncbi:MAG: hypothetical protein NT038_07955 [Euryarchaeota archaeon]|nr:hypothetical protein [Euryarchaeota archaeon]